MPINRPRFALPLCIALGGFIWAEPALAAGLATARFGGEHGTPVNTNPTAVYYNPASIAHSEGIHLFVDGSLAVRAATYTYEELAADGSVVPENSGEATLLNLAASPMLGASAKFGDFALGAGFYVPFGGAASWDRNATYENSTQYAGPVDGVQRWHSIESSLTATFFTLAAAYKIPGINLSLGVSGNLISTQVSTIRARNVDSSSNLALEGRSLLDVSGIHGSFGAGALLEAMPKTLWIGASYQSRPNVTGGERLKGTITNRFNGVPQAPADVELHQGLPDIIRLGARYVPMEGLEVRLFGDFTRWSSMENQCLTDVGAECEINEDGSAKGPGVVQNVARRWNDAFGVRAGLSYWPQQTVELFGGLGYDSNAVPDETLDPSGTDFHDISFAFGGRFQLLEKLHLAATYTHLFYVDRDTTGKSIASTLASPSTNPDAGGLYSQTVGVLNVNVDVGF